MNNHISLGDQSFLNQFGAYSVLARDIARSEYDWVEWQILIRDVHDIGDLAVRRRDVCLKVGYTEMAQKWNDLSVECADLIEDFNDCLDAFLPDIAKKRAVIWN